MDARASARGAIVVFDNRRMGAISQLQQAQYGSDFGSSDSVPVDYVQMAASVLGVKALSGRFDPSSLTAALEEAFDYDGLSLIHVPVTTATTPGAVWAPTDAGTSATGATTCRTATCAR